MRYYLNIFLLIILPFVASTTVFAQSSVHLSLEQRRQLFMDELQFNSSHEVLRYASSHLHQHSYYYGSSGDLFEQFVQFLFPLTGRENRIMFMPLSSWGPKKPQYKKFDWQKYESQHFVFYYDKSAYASFKKAHAFLEDDFSRNNEIFSVRNKFLKKIPIIIYQSRKDFEQTNIVSGPVPEGLGGVTEIFSWKRAVFPFEGEMSTFEHVTKHEGTHIYQIAKGAKNLPLWFIEGSAETNSIYWDADAEQYIRDAYLNDLFFDIDDLWQIRGTWLMYKIGNYICNFIREKYGERALQKIYQNSLSLKFSENIKQSLGVSLQELNRMVQASLSIKYGFLYKKSNPYEQALKIQKRAVVLHAYKNFFISGKGNGSSNALYINYVDELSKVHKHKIISDKKLNSESLNYFRKGAWLNGDKLVYSIKNGSNDEIRLLGYSFDRKNKRFKLDKKPLSIRFKNIRSIFSPVIVAKNTIVFIGIKNGFSNIYQYDYNSKKLEQITKDSAHYSNLDYSAAKNTLVFSKELQRSANRIYYNRDIFEYDFQTKKMVSLSQTPEIREDNPRYSISGTNILFSSDEDGTHNLYLYNSLTKAKQKLSNHPAGIKTAVWSHNDSLLLNVNSRFVSDIVHMQLPKPYDMLNNEINYDASKSISVFSKDKNYIYSPQNADENSSEMEVGFNKNNKIRSDKDGIYLFYNDQKYRIKKIAPLENELFIQATNTNNDKQRIQSLEDKTLYFKVKDQDVTSIYDPIIQKDSSSKKITEKINTILKDKVIISTWNFNDDASVLVQVNEKLSVQNTKSQNNNKATTNLYACDLKVGNCNILRGSKLENFKKEIFWAVKLEHGSYLWTLSENKNGPYEVFLYDNKLKRTLKIGNDILRFKVSENKTSFSMLNGDSFIIYEFSEKNRWKAKQYKPSGSVVGYDFLKKSNDFMIITSHKKYLNIHLLKKEKTSLKKIKHSINNVVHTTINKNTGDFVVYAKSQSNSEMMDKLYYWDGNSNDFYDISVRGKLKTFNQVVFIDDFLIFTGKNFSYENFETWVWKNKERKQLRDIVDAKEVDKDASWVVNLENDLYLFQFKKDEYKKIANDSFGYDIHKKNVFYASTNNEKYNIYKYDVTLDKNNLFIASKNHAFNPKLFKDNLYYQSYDDKVINVRQYVSDQNSNALAYALKNHHVLMQKNNDDVEIKFNLLPYHEQVYSGPELTTPKIFPIEDSSAPAKDIYKLQSLVAAAAYDGSSFRILLNGYVDNIFSDKGAFVNITLLGENKFAVFGISNLRNATSYSLFYNERENIQNFGINFNKRFNLDRYRAFNILTEFERQIYGDATADTISYVDSDVENKRFNVVKLSSTYDHDVTLWDRHGPISGSRVFFRLSSGLDLTEQRLAYYSGNTDIRYYNSILNKFSLAHRLSAGTSQGALPEIYLAGGNLSFRGVNFDDLQGQNYAIFSEDIRLPLFDFIGAKFFDPLDSFVGFLTRFFDVRTGAFIDIGDVWYNDEDFEIMYASGFFANVPSLLGVNLRFHYSVWGEQGFGFWIGSNW